MKKSIIIFGTSEIASIAQYYFTTDSEYTVVAFTVDDAFVETNIFEGLPVIPFSEIKSTFSPNEYSMHVALSYVKLNQLREEKYNQAKNAGYKLVSYVSSKASTWPDLTIGDNCFILEDQTIQPSVKIGNNVMLWSGNHLGHGSVIQDHCYLSSHVVVSGNCNIGKRCFFGVNSSLKDFLNIGDDVFIGMDATIVKNMKNGSVALGEGSNILEPDDRKAYIIKKSYFKL